MADLKNLLSKFAKKQIDNEMSQGLKDIREKALSKFKKIGMPYENLKDENWKDLKLSQFIEKKYSMECNIDNDISTFTCELIDMNAQELYLLNSKKIQINGHTSHAVVKNIVDIDKKTIDNYFNKIADDENGFNVINTASFTGGFFIYVPDNKNVEIPLQLIAINNCDTDTFSNVRNLIIIGKNSSVKIIQCDDTIDNNDYFLNTVTEIFVDENSYLELYKMYNISNSSASINSIYIKQEKNSIVKSFSFELNAGVLRNNLFTDLHGENAESYTYGIYLVDKKQQIDNYVKIIHTAPNCISEQIFKGIIDDYAHSIFNGLIVVDSEAQKTAAAQINRNILLTDKARATSKPFLEIYADDVKCSHGATVGQLDENALFYLQTRGISMEKARMLLLHAFVGEIISKIKIDAISLRINDLVKKRLNGELSDCESCILRCSDAQINKDCH